MKFVPINNSLYDTSTEAEVTELCQNPNKHIYAGQKITIFLRTIDKLNRSVQSFVFITISKGNSSMSPHFYEVYKSDWHMPIIENYQLIEEKNDSRSNCTALNLTLLTNDIHPYPGVIIVDLSLKSSNKINRNEYTIKFRSCPIGFENKGNKICECDTLITAPSRSCDISSKNITSDDISWIGMYKGSNNKSTLAYSQYCPIGYCNIKSLVGTSRIIKVNDDNNAFEVVLSNEVSASSKSMCESNRGGILCGECINGTSIVYGPNNCHVCSDWWLLTLMVYLTAGPLLIYLLYALKLTITTGTINGIIFYAQAANCGLTTILQYPKYTHEGYLSLCSTIAIAFLKFLNLEVGYPTCLYNGMDMLVKMYFSFIEILYLLSILLLIIIFSRYSTRLSNYIADSSIQVLVTILHISFYKIINSVATVLSYTEVHTKAFGPISVWTYDGSIVYFSKEHTALVIFTLFIASILLVPYIALLLGGRVLLKYSDKFRPVYEAIHGPYKEKKNYWFTARLFLLITINVIYLSLHSVNPSYIVLFTSVLLMVFIIVQAHIRPFKNHLINILDLLVMVLFFFQYMFSWFAIFYEYKHWNYLWVFVASVILLFIFFIAVIFGHVLWVTGKYKKVKDLFRRDMSRSVFRINIHHKRVRLNSCNDDSYYQSCDIRDSILDSH
uniref:TRP C-terminal domain-containing protein n=1 Tax=Amphimedon queenslandica TaxID=400682 RepID=A0A1X7UGH8_AMPQE